jgi:hypothetical protein
MAGQDRTEPIDRLWRLAEVAPALGEDGKWLAERLLAYLAPDAECSLEDALDLRPTSGQQHWACQSAPPAGQRFDPRTGRVSPSLESFSAGSADSVSASRLPRCRLASRPTQLLYARSQRWNGARTDVPDLSSRRRHAHGWRKIWEVLAPEFLHDTGAYAAKARF